MASASLKIIEDYFGILTIPPQHKGFGATKLSEGQLEIRLFSIAKADDMNDPMITSLSGHSLNDSMALGYVALSYVWGDLKPSDRIE